MFKLSAIANLVLAGGILAAQDSKPLPPPPILGKAIQDAALAATHDRPRDCPEGGTVDSLYGGEGKAGNVEVLTDTQGVNFGPYLNDVVTTVRKNWYALVPADARTKKGKLAIELAIHKDGSMTNLHLAAASGDLSLDRAAWGAITASNPFPALPSAFTGSYLVLRFRFLYNPDKAGLDGASNSTSGRASGGTVSKISDPLVRAILAKSVEDSGLPEYPKKARKNKVEGMVRLEAQIAPDGTVESVASVDGSPLLGDAAAHAIRKWTFHPAQRDGKPVKDTVRINVEFYLDRQRVRAQVVRPEDAQPENAAR
jgi:TonB family protein